MSIKATNPRSGTETQSLHGQRGPAHRSTACIKATNPRSGTETRNVPCQHPVIGRIDQALDQGIKATNPRSGTETRRIRAAMASAAVVMVYVSKPRIPARGLKHDGVLSGSDVRQSRRLLSKPRIPARGLKRDCHPLVSDRRRSAVSKPRIPARGLKRPKRPSSVNRPVTGYQSHESPLGD